MDVVVLNINTKCIKFKNKMSHDLIVAEALTKVNNVFPFKEYMLTGDKLINASYSNVAKTVLRYLKPGAKILDFGCGPCDKTAVIQSLGFSCSAYDDLQDPWHCSGNNRQLIIKFAKQIGIDFHLADEQQWRFSENEFDMIMLHDVLEHLHDSPKGLINNLIPLLKTGGFLFITVPNAVNLRKRISVLFGSTNLPCFSGYYWSQSPWRGHVREYVKEDLMLMCRFSGLNIVELHGCDHMLQKLPHSLRPIYLALTSVFSGFKDTLLLVAQKPENWTPKEGLTKVEQEQVLEEHVLRLSTLQK